MTFQLHLNSETVAQVHTEDPPCLAPSNTVRDAFRLLKEKKTGALLVCQDDVLVGIFTERDALKLMADEADLDVTIDQVMTANPVSLSVQDTVGKAIARMSYGGYRRLPIVDDEGRTKGFVRVSRILHFLVEHFPAVIYNLPPTPHHTTQEREGA